jgi:hypothetical protein
MAPTLPSPKVGYFDAGAPELYAGGRIPGTRCGPVESAKPRPSRLQSRLLAPPVAPHQYDRGLYPADSSGECKELSELL